MSTSTSPSGSDSRADIEDDEATTETFNGLSVKYQLNPEHDAEYIFPDEYDLIKELRRRQPVLNNYSDKWLVTFLCARRHDVDAAADLIRRYLDKMAELGFDKKFPSLRQADFDEVMSTLPFCVLPGNVDKHGRQVQWLFLSKSRPLPLETMLAWTFWSVEFFIERNSLSVLRNGNTMIMNFAGWSLRQMDMANQHKQREVVQNIMPIRIRNIYFTNTGVLFKVFYNFVKVFAPRKMVKRMAVLSQDDLRGLVDDKNRVAEFGANGDIVLATLNYRDMMLEYDKTLQKSMKLRKRKIRDWRKSNVHQEAVKHNGDGDDSVLG